LSLNQYQEEVQLEADAQSVFDKVREWLPKHDFIIKTEISPTYLNSYTGWAAFFMTNKQARRWLDVQIKPYPPGCRVSIREKVRFLALMTSSLIKEEVILLLQFLMTTFRVSPSVRKCPSCNAPVLDGDATFCGRCGVHL